MRKLLPCLLGGLIWMQAAACLGDEWDMLLMPGSLHQEPTVELFHSQTQAIPLMLQASQEIKDRSNTHEVEVILDLPESVKCLLSNGFYKLIESEQKSENGRTRYRYRFQVTNTYLAGVPGGRARSEWRSQSFFVTTPEQIPAKDAYLEMDLRSDGAPVKTKRWKLDLVEMKPVEKRPKETVIGLWDYGLERVEPSAELSRGLARFLSQSGVNFVSKGTGRWAEAMKQNAIVRGGKVHHSSFHDREYRDIAADGGSPEIEFACPQMVSELPQDAVIPGVSALINMARRGDGVACFDYEPCGLDGFSDRSIEVFCEKYGVTSEEFVKFRAYVAKHRFKTYQTKDPFIAKTWKQWTEFRTAQSKAYMKRVYDAVKTEAPEVKLAMTPRRTFGDDSIYTQALGCNNGAMSNYSDVIMPQFYAGYDEMGVKLVMDWTTGMMGEIAKAPRSKDIELWPLLLIRYAGAADPLRNEPKRMRQQIFATLSHGAHGFLLYYPDNMDRGHWSMLAKVTEEIADYERFYRHGERVDNEFEPLEMPRTISSRKVWPDLNIPIRNPAWEVTAHKLEGRYLLTLFNLDARNIAKFRFAIEGVKVVDSYGVKTLEEGGWEVPPEEIGFIILEKNGGEGGALTVPL